MKGSILTGMIALAIIATSQPRLADGRSELVDLGQEREAFYLPQGEALRLFSLGFDNAASDILWFNTINYFGKHYAGSRNYRWLGHMCNLVTELNPRVSEVYEFCASMLAWEAGNPPAAVELLSRAIEHKPEEWLYLYLRGFFHLHFLNDPDKATADFVAAAQLPNCHPVVRRLAARGLARNDPSVAIDLLLLSIERASDPKERAALEERLHEAIFERDVRLLEHVLQQSAPSNRPRTVAELQQLVSQQLPQVDPWGMPYQITAEGTIAIPEGRRRLTDYYRPQGGIQHD